MPLALGLCPLPTTAFAKVVGGTAALLGCFWNAPMALVAYNAQERIPPLAGFHPPSVLRQYELIPEVARNSVHLLLHGHSPLHSSAYFFPDWQIEAIRVAGRAGEVGALLVSCALAGSLVWLRRARDASSASGALGGHTELAVIPAHDLVDVELDRHPLVEHGLDEGLQFVAVAAVVAREDRDAEFPEFIGIL